MDPAITLKEGTGSWDTPHVVTNGKIPRIEVSERDEALVRDILGHVAGKWPLWTLHVLGDNEAPLRFARLLERVEGISQKMLTQTLRHLERDGLVSRTVFAEVPPRVEYALTSDGREILVRFKPFWMWIAGRTNAFAEARARFDGGSSSVEPAKVEDT